MMDWSKPKPEIEISVSIGIGKKIKKRLTEIEWKSAMFPILDVAVQDMIKELERQRENEKENEL